MLTDGEREDIRTTDIEEKKVVKSNIRSKIDKTIRDLNLVLQNYTLIETESGIGNDIDDKEAAELVSNLLYLMDNDHIDNNIVYMIISQCENNWTVPNNDYVLGNKQELALSVFLRSFSDFDSSKKMCPDPEDLEGWEEFSELVEDIGIN